MFTTLWISKHIKQNINNMYWVIDKCEQDFLSLLYFVDAGY